MKNAEYMPYIVFLAAPSADVQRQMWEEGRRRGVAGKKGVRIKTLPPPIRGLAGQDIPDMAGLIKKHVMIKKIGGWASKQKSNEQDEKKLFPGDNFDDFIG